MPSDSLKRFILFIVLPSIMVIVLFIITIFVVILPSTERDIMEGKKEMISELTGSVISLLEEFRTEAVEQHLSTDSAKALAAERIERIRYGEARKDYFWIIDKQPRMVMHPYRPELVGQDLSRYQDAQGKLPFVESVRTVEKSGEGFIEYMWPWPDDSTRIVPKLSYVKEFPSWNWIVGTGIYLEDVRLEIRSLKNQLLRVVLFIALVVSILLAVINRWALGIERRKKIAEDARLLSREKYNSLVESVTEGTLMIVNGRILFSNDRFGDQSGYTPEEVGKMKFEALFNLKLKHLAADVQDPGKSVTRETQLTCRDGSKKEVVISASRVSFAEHPGYIILVKELSSQMQFEKNRELLSGELQTVLLMMHQPLKSICREIRRIRADAPVREAIKMMSRNRNDILFVHHNEQIVGVINQQDLIERVLATGLDPGKKVIEIMTSPVVSLPEDALICEGLISMKKQGLSHLALMGPGRNITGVVGFREIGGIQENLAGFLIREILKAEGVEQIRRSYVRLPVMIKALMDSGGQTGMITRIVSSVGDAIHKRLIDLAQEELGPAPCKFAFIVLASQGRGEQAFNTDQDNAIVTVNMQESYRQGAQVYFKVLAGKVNRDLEAVGYRECPGNYMASNPRWNRELAIWKRYFTGWISGKSPGEILTTDFFFDLRCVYGEQILVDQLRAHIIKNTREKAGFFYHMARSISQMKVPSRLEGPTLDLKKILRPITSFLRLYAIREGLSATGSRERAEQLRDRGIINQSLFEDLIEAFDFINQLRFRNQVEQIARNETPGNIIDISQLTRIESVNLKQHLHTIAGLQNRLHTEFSSEQKTNT